MPVFSVIPIWKTAPFLRILPPLIAGILLQWYLQPGILPALITGAICTLLFIIFSFLPDGSRFRLEAFRGLLFQVFFVTAGAGLAWMKDIRNQQNWYGQWYTDSSYVVLRVGEPLIEKTKSYKAEGYVEALVANNTQIKATGKVFIYFAKDSTSAQLQYGDRILLHKKLQPIKNSGNPGGFNYQRYALFQQAVHTIYLKDNDWVKLKGSNRNWFRQFIYTSRQNILDILQRYVGNNKDELGIAEALLIGYTNDLDKDLVQAYSNTGVVHIIAISGMHLGLIYLMLVWLFGRLPFTKKNKWLQVTLILGCLWLFSLLTGGSASVIRSAVMFTFITVGKNFFRQTSIFNSLAASGFFMLLYNPFYLWDVGFQLSYLAVVGIVLFQKPIYHAVSFRRRLPDAVWKMMAVTLAAQTLTFPVCIYYFHQFPILFPIANLLAVPLSTLILYTEIVLVAFWWLPVVGLYAGKAVAAMVWLLNKCILAINALPFSVWDSIPAGVLSTLLLYAVVIAVATWLLQRSKAMLRLSLWLLLGFVLVHAFSSWKVHRQQKIIVYNVPQHRAVDFIRGNTYCFVGDSILLQDGLLQNFHLKPARTALQLTKRKDSLQQIFRQGSFYQFGHKRILLVHEPLRYLTPAEKIPVDIIVISANAKLQPEELAKVFNPGLLVFDASNSLWKIEQWKQACEKLHLRHYSIPEQGAFVLDVE
ncbi:MAG TPA: ComEC/Rec2 family competence protein [Ferruginibacter sp.]|nr:ComEC/Rec2 family competence protein [Ferruginibacter sp.]HMP19768.1 ComEC/Rec2 family competence protein [Ferruginibacter sp.]